MVKNRIKTRIDVLIQRCAKVLGIAVNLAIIPFRATAGLRWISLVSVVVLVVGVVVVRFVGRRFEDMTSRAEAQWQQWQNAQNAQNARISGEEIKCEI